jgi:uncharacterized membrane protein YeaQ/YmgE (transglycosylase-associated protein family)
VNLSGIVQLLILGAIVGVAARAFFVHSRQMPYLKAAAVGAVAIFVLGLILTIVGLDNGLGLVLAMAGAIIAVVFAARFSPEPVVSRAPVRVDRRANSRTENGERTLQEFDVSLVGLNDGVAHTLGQARCTLTDQRLIIDDIRGGIHQIPLKDISGVSVPGPIVSPKQLRVSVPMASYDIYCNSKDQRVAMELWLSDAIRGEI